MQNASSQPHLWVFMVWVARAGTRLWSSSPRKSLGLWRIAVLGQGHGKMQVALQQLANLNPVYEHVNQILIRKKPCEGSP